MNIKIKGYDILLDLDGKMVDAIDYLNKRLIEGWTHLEEDDYGLYLIKFRPETEEEKEERQQKETFEEAIQKERRRKDYEKMKLEFGGE